MFLLVAPLLAQAALAAACPDDQVGGLQVTLPEGTRLRVERTWLEVELELVAADGAVQARRSFAGDLACDALRAAVQVTVESWSLALAPQAVPSPPPLPSEPLVVEAPASAPVASMPWRLELAAAFSESVTAAGGAPGGLAALFADPPRWPVWLELAFTAQANRGSAIAGGSYSWNRAGLGLGPSYRWRYQSATLDVGFLAWAALVSASGDTGVPQAQSSSGVDFGVGASAVLAYHFERLAPFVGLWPTLWLPDQTAVTGTTATAVIPDVELSGGIGLAFDL